MKIIMLMFDSLNRHMLSSYGCDWTHTPSFNRLAEKTVKFNNCYIGSMPCMPARRELHTGRYNFLHRSWGPLEPFDDSAIELMTKNGIYTHLITDHQHYWEDGGATFHNRYNSYEFIRGQEGDRWYGEVKEPEVPEEMALQKKILKRYDMVNRKHIKKEADQSQSKVFERGLAFLKDNHKADNWFLQIESFDPHEPFMSPEKYKELYPELDVRSDDWPNYGLAPEDEKERRDTRLQYAALLSMCDVNLSHLLDFMDEHNMWEDTMLIVNTDHGFLLNEHEYWGKMVMPFYNEIAHTPLFIWDPRYQKYNEARESLVQMIDIPPTLLGFFNIDKPKDMEGRSLEQTIDHDEKIRDAALFGLHGGHICVTDGRYVYMRGLANKENAPLYQYTLMPMHSRQRFLPEQIQTARLADPFDFTKKCQVLRMDAGYFGGFPDDMYSASGKTPIDDLHKNFLFDLETDPEQKIPISDSKIEQRMVEYMILLMQKNDAPIEQYQRTGLR